MLKPSYIILPLLLYALSFMFQTLPPAPRSPTITRTFGPIVSLPPPDLSRHSATFIFLHGLGDTGNGWAPVSKDLAPHLPHVKFLFPTAPTRNITVSMGMSMPGWFDIAHLDINSLKDMMEGKPADEKGIDESVAYIHQLVDIEMKNGIPRHRIVVGGFSQGGHIALKTALSPPPSTSSSTSSSSLPPLAGCIALSTWLETPNPSRTTSKTGPIHASPPHPDLPILVGHGSADPLIPAAIATATLRVLQDTLALKNIDFKIYPGLQHSSSPQEMKDIRDFLVSKLPPTTTTSGSEKKKRVVSEEEVEKMTTRELKAFITEQGQSVVGLLEKYELVDKAKSLLD